MSGYRRTLGQDAEQAHNLGLSWADGDRIVTIPNYPVSTWPEGHHVTRRMVYWSVTWRTPAGVRDSSGVAATMLAARGCIATAVHRDAPIGG